MNDEMKRKALAHVTLIEKPPFGGYLEFPTLETSIHEIRDKEIKVNWHFPDYGIGWFELDGKKYGVGTPKSWYRLTYDLSETHGRD